MIFSIFNWNGDARSGRYVYFEGPGEGLGIRPTPRSVVSDDRGHKLELLLPVVPTGSRQIGRGSIPRGRIAVLNEDLRAALGDDAASSPNPVVSHPWLSVIGWAAIVFGGYYVARYVGSVAAQRGHYGQR